MYDAQCAESQKTQINKKKRSRDFSYTQFYPNKNQVDYRTKFPVRSFH